ncbi:hypothetical protein D3C86_1819250 [compost metagenome]
MSTTKLLAARWPEVLPVKKEMPFVMPETAAATRALDFSAPMKVLSAPETADPAFERRPRAPPFMTPPETPPNDAPALGRAVKPPLARGVAPPPMRESKEPPK